MKKTYSVLIGAALLAVVAFTSFTPKTVAQQSQQRLPGAVVFGVQERYVNGFPQSYTVYVVSQGKNAPQVLPGMELAPVIENLLADGFDITLLGGFHLMAVRK